MKPNGQGSFNRYMVECESRQQLSYFPEQFRFNRYMVECEYSKMSCMWKTINVLIDTWWNVNNIMETKYGYAF